MTKLLFLLLLPVTFFGQTVTKVVKTSTTAAGHMEWKPSDFDQNRAYPLMVFCAGISSRGTGSATDLDKLINGEVPANLQRAVEKYKFILIAPQTADNYDGEIDYARNYAMGKYKIDPEHMALAGFSLGGGDVVRYALQSVNANKFACLIPIAMTSQTGTWSNISNQKLATWFFHNLNDDNAGTRSWFTDSTVARINRTNPTVPAVKTIFNANGHGGGSEALNPDGPPLALNGFGLTNPSMTVYEWFMTSSESNPIPPPGKLAPTGLVANGQITMSNDTAILDGRSSFNYKSAKWDKVSVPAGVNIWNVNACGDIICKVKLPAPGGYTFRLFVTNSAGQTATQDVNINYSIVPPVTPPPTPTPTRKVKYRIIVYDDGSIETIPEGTTYNPPKPGPVFLNIHPAQIFDISQARKQPERLFDNDTTTVAFNDYFNEYILNTHGGQIIYILLDSFINNAKVEVFNGQYASGGQVDFQLFYSTDTVRKSPVFSTTLESLKWKILDLPWSDSARLLKIRIASAGSNNFSEVKVFGSKLGLAPMALPAFKPQPPDEGKYFMGYNKLHTDTLLDDAGYSQRAINDAGFIDTFQNTNGKRVLINRYGNSIAATYYPAIRNGRKVHPAIASVREAFKYDGSNDSKDMPKGADSTRIESWAIAANMYFGLTAKMGRNKTPDVDGYVFYNTPDGFGLNVIEEIEVGNEDDARWAGPLRHHSARVKIMKLTAAYDAIKKADATMKVISGALTGVDTSYLKAMWLTCKFLGIQAPFDVLAINEYATNSGGQHAGTSDGISPEDFNMYEKLAAMIRTRDRYFPGIPVYLTEFGYDVHEGSNYDVPAIAGQTKEQTKAYWVLRTIEAAAAAKISKAFQYTAKTAGGGDFGTTGIGKDTILSANAQIPEYLKQFTEGKHIGGGYVVFPTYLYWVMVCRAKTLADYNAWPVIVRNGGNTGIWILKYSHISDTRKFVFSFWSGTDDNTMIHNYALSTGAATARLFTPTVGIKQNVIGLNIINGTVWVSVTECPQYIEVTI